MLKNMEPGGKVRHTKKCLIQAVMKIASGARRARTEMTALENRFHLRQASSASRKSVVGLNCGKRFWSAILLFGNTFEK